MQQPETSRRHGRLTRYGPLILWIGLIFFFSTMQGSVSNTSGFIRPLLIFLFPGASEETLIIYHGYLRKFAHFAEYAALAFWASRAFWSSAAEFLKKYWYFWAFLTVLVTAATDEFNQSFNSTRTGSIYDVMLDAFGGLVMILMLYGHTAYRNNYTVN